jgi:hypothetical protein
LSKNSFSASRISAKVRGSSWRNATPSASSMNSAPRFARGQYRRDCAPGHR